MLSFARNESTSEPRQSLAAFRKIYYRMGATCLEQSVIRGWDNNRDYRGMGNIEQMSKRTSPGMKWGAGGSELR